MSARQSHPPTDQYRDVAVLIPCHNEERTIAKVVGDFARVLPGATIHVYDNNSDDRTGEAARAAGAVVTASPRQGKGHAVQQMFVEVDAPYFVMVDGDDTYSADLAPALVAVLREGRADMAVGARVPETLGRPFPRFHRTGNRLVARTISLLFGTRVTDALSGFRAFNRAFVKGVALTSAGFEVEAEMTLQALLKDFRIEEVPVPYGSRPSGSFSKLKTYSDGYLVLRTILWFRFASQRKR